MRACMQIMALSLSSLMLWPSGSEVMTGAKSGHGQTKKEQRNPAKESVGTKEV